MSGCLHSFGYRSCSTYCSNPLYPFSLSFLLRKAPRGSRWAFTYSLDGRTSLDAYRNRVADCNLAYVASGVCLRQSWCTGRLGPQSTPFQGTQNVVFWLAEKGFRPALAASVTQTTNRKEVGCDTTSPNKSALVSSNICFISIFLHA